MRISTTSDGVNERREGPDGKVCGTDAESGVDFRRARRRVGGGEREKASSSALSGSEGASEVGSKSESEFAGLGDAEEGGGGVAQRRVLRRRVGRIGACGEQASAAQRKKSRVWGATQKVAKACALLKRCIQNLLTASP